MSVDYRLCQPEQRQYRQCHDIELGKRNGYDRTIRPRSQRMPGCQPAGAYAAVPRVKAVDAEPGRPNARLGRAMGNISVERACGYRPAHFNVDTAEFDVEIGRIVQKMHVQTGIFAARKLIQIN